MSILIDAGTERDRALGFDLDNEYNIISDMMNSSIDMMNGDTDVNREIKKLSNRYPDYEFKSGGKRLVAIPTAEKKKFVIKASRYEGKLGCYDNVNEFTIGNEIDDEFPNEGYVPRGIALLGTERFPNMIHVQERFLDIMDELLKGGYSKDDVVSVYYKKYVLTNRTRLDKMFDEVFGDCVKTDNSMTVSLNNYGLNARGKIGLLDLGSTIRLPNGYGLKCPMCGGELEYKRVGYDIIKNIADSGIAGMDYDKHTDIYVCTSNKTHRVKTEVVFAEMNEMEHKNIPSKIIVPLREIRAKSSRDERVEEEYDNDEIDLYDLGIDAIATIDSKKYRLKNDEIVNQLIEGRDLVGYITVNKFKTRNGSIVRKVYDSKQVLLGYVK